MRNPCEHCGKVLSENKRPHARFCNRSCKSKAHDAKIPVEVRRAKDRARYQKEREHRLAYASEYQKKNPDVPKRAKNKRRARKAAAGVYTVTKKDWARLVSRFDNKCFYCGDDGKVTMDHVIPLSRGGRHSIGNLIPACLTCNSKKRTRTVMEWRKDGGISTLPTPCRRANVA